MLDLWLKLAYSNLWIALAAGAQVYVNFRLLGAEASAEAMLLAVLAMFWVYTFAKAVHFDPAADLANDPERTAFLRRYRLPLCALGVLGLAFGSWLAFRHGAATLGFFWAPTLIGLLYDLRFLPAGFRYRRLKEVPGLKGTSVAFAWTVLSLGLCWRYGLEASAQQWLFLSWWNSAMWFVNTTYFDMGDLDGDRLEGTRTLPVVLGFANTRRLLHGINGVAALSLSRAAEVGLVQAEATRLLWLSGLQAMLLVRAHSEDADISFECDILFDGVFLFGALLLVYGPTALLL